jgi:hypothetical protein
MDKVRKPSNSIRREFYILISRKKHAIDCTTGRLVWMNWECLGRQPLVSAFRNRNTDRPHSLRGQMNRWITGRTETRDRSPDVVERVVWSQHPKGAVSRVYRWGRMAAAKSALHCLAKGLIFMAYRLRWKLMCSVASSEWLRAARNSSWI